MYTQDELSMGLMNHPQVTRDVDIPDAASDSTSNKQESDAEITPSGGGSKEMPRDDYQTLKTGKCVLEKFCSGSRKNSELQVCVQYSGDSRYGTEGNGLQGTGQKEYFQSSSR
jgi:hypothetical protein